MADLPAQSEAITGTCRMELERFDEIGTRGKRNLEDIFLEMAFRFLEEIITY